MQNITKMEPDDWERVREIRLRALRTDPLAFGSTHEREFPQPESWWRGRLGDPEVATFVMNQEPDGDVGLVTGAPFRDRGGAGLFSMWVAPEVRGQRLGEALIERVVDWARGSGYDLLRLEVADGNTGAIKLYARMGFLPSGRVGTLPPPRDHVTEHERILQLNPPVDPS